MEQETKGVMNEKPRDPREPILNKPLKKWMTAIFFISGIAAFLSFFILLKLTGDLDKTRTIIFVLMGLDSLVFAFSTRSFKHTIFRKDIFSNIFLSGGVGISAVLLVAGIYLPPLQNLLSTQPLGLIDWFIIIGRSFAEILLIEFYTAKIFFKS